MEIVTQHLSQAKKGSVANEEITNLQRDIQVLCKCSCDSLFKQRQGTSSTGSG